MKFTCRRCRASGSANSRRGDPFLHTLCCEDQKGLVPNCIYWRFCGATHNSYVDLKKHAAPTLWDFGDHKTPGDTTVG